MPAGAIQSFPPAIAVGPVARRLLEDGKAGHGCQPYYVRPQSRGGGKLPQKEVPGVTAMAAAAGLSFASLLIAACARAIRAEGLKGL